MPERFGRGLLTRVFDRVDSPVLQARRSARRVVLRSARRPERPSSPDAGRGGARPRRSRRRLAVTASRRAEGRVEEKASHLPRASRAAPGCRPADRGASLLDRRGVEFEAQIAGRGPSESELREAVSQAGLDGRVSFVGFLSDHRDVEAFVAAGSVAVAPYDTEVESFTRFADPSKLRSYTAAGLPIVLTDVPPNAGELEREAGAR